MKKKPQTENDVVAVMNKIQAQLAVLDQKLDTFMTKSLTELAQARAAAMKPVQAPQHQAPRHQPQVEQRPSRPMYAVVCFECGKNTEIPFKPSADRPVYCKECFAKRKAARVGGPKPQIISIAPAPAPAPAKAAEIPAKDKKKPAATKKSGAKKKVVAKKK